MSGYRKAYGYFQPTRVVFYGQIVQMNSKTIPRKEVSYFFHV